MIRKSASGTSRPLCSVMTMTRKSEDPLYVSKKVKEIDANRDRLRRQSEERVRMGLRPFPTVVEIQRHPNPDKIEAHKSLMEIAQPKTHKG